MTVAEPRLLQPPAILARGGGLVLLHNGVIDGPHGLMMVIDILEEPGSGALRTPDWTGPGLPSPLTVTATGPDGEPVQPKVMTSDGGPGYHRAVVTFGRYGKPTRLSPEDTRIAVTLAPPGLSAAINLAGGQ
ncbi:hypothetical protein GA0074692_2575 [Micromonospora pallida]|uniref:Uncharacterized protein n=1 Tax=Micromonospora pallida TaxID=145854 RepID=A0A1C6SGQ0_9ACTN|nr:hypothetical protein [Micromonospora pallida]SCL28626.1 hypothetical protein GA0074692_2575 [Micromonospora pallida]